MESPGDSTAVIRMRKDFDDFISGSGSKLEQPSFRLNLDAEVYPSVKGHQPTSTEAIRKVLGNYLRLRLVGGIKCWKLHCSMCHMSMY